MGLRPTYLSESDRAAALQSSLHHYIHHRFHTGIKSKTHRSVRPRVHNLFVKNTLGTHSSELGMLPWDKPRRVPADALRTWVPTLLRLRCLGVDRASAECGSGVASHL